MSAGIQYKAADNLGNVVDVSAATPLPVTGGGTPAAPSSVVETPNATATSAPTTTSSTVAEGSRIAKVTGGNCYGFNVVSGASAGYFMLFNSATVPADGTVTPLRCYVVAANASLAVSWDTPRRFGAGITGVFSTTGPFTKTISATAFISIDYV